MKTINLPRVKILFLPCALCLSTWASAHCYPSQTIVRIDFPAVISVPRDAVNGTVLGSFKTSPYQMDCKQENDIDPAQGFWQYYLAGTNSDYGAGSQSDTRKSGYAGVDIWWEHCNDKAYPSQCGIKTRGPLNNTGSFRQQDRVMLADLTDEVKLIKSGSMTSGVWNGMTINHSLRYSYADPNRERGHLFRIVVPQVTFNVLACSVRNSSILVNMDNVSRYAFSSGIGSVTPPVEFFVDLLCDDQTPVNIILETPAEGMANAAQGVMNLTSASTASGIGIQVKHKGAPVEFDKMFRVAIAQGAGEVRIPFTANYYRIGTVQPGSANAVANFTMVYQ